MTDIPDSITGAVLRRISGNRDDIAHLLTHERKAHPGGSGIRSEIPGETAHLDIQETQSPDLGTKVACALVISDETTTFGMGFGLKSKPNAADAFNRYQAFLRVYGRRCTKIRLDHASEAGAEYLAIINRQLETPLELLQPFPSPPDAPENVGVDTLKAAPEHYGKMFERRWQTLKRDWTYSMIAQDNLTTNYWLWALLNAIDKRNGVLGSNHPSMTPFQHMTGSKPSAKQMTSFRYGSLAVTPRTGPRVGSPGTWSDFQLCCVVASPLLTPGTHMVLLEGTTKPVPRGDVRPILEHPVERTDTEWTALQPVYDAKGRLQSLHAGAKTDFTLHGLLRKYQGKQMDPKSDGKLTDVQKGTLELWQGKVGARGVIDTNNTPRIKPGLGLMLPQPLTEAGVRSTLTVPTSSSAPASTHQPSINEQPSAQDSLVFMPTNAEDMELMTTNNDGPLHQPTTGTGHQPNDLGANDLAVAFNTFTVDDQDDLEMMTTFNTTFGAWPTDGEQQWLHFLRTAHGHTLTATDLTTPSVNPAAQSTVPPTAHRPWSTFATRVVRTEANPSYQTVVNCPKRKEKWKPPVRKFIDGGLATGIHNFITQDTFDKGNFILLPWVAVFIEKRNGDLKFRLTPDGGKEDKDYFKEFSLYAAGVDPDALKAHLAHSSYVNLALSFSDVENAYPEQNRWEYSANPRNVAVHIPAYISGTGTDELMELRTNTNGFRDASATWMHTHDRMLLKWGGIRSTMCRQMFYRFLGNSGYARVAAYVDDKSIARTRNTEGTELLRQLRQCEANAGFFLKHKELDDCPEGADFMSLNIRNVQNQHGRAIAITQPNQAKVIAARLGSAVRTDPTFFPRSSGWSPLVSAQAAASGTDRADTTNYLCALGQLQWTSLSAPRGNMLSILSSHSHNAGLIDEQCLDEVAHHYLSTAHIPFMLYQCPRPIDIHEVVQFTTWVDAGETGDPSGRGREAQLIKLGDADSPSGAIILKSHNINQSDNTCGDELVALANAVPYVDALRVFAEECAGLRLDPHVTSRIVPGSPPPTLTLTGQTAEQAANSTDGGDANCVIRAETMKLIAASSSSTTSSPSINHPPTTVLGDNQIVVNLGMSAGNMNVKSLRGHLRYLRSIWQMVLDEMMTVVKIKSEQNIVNVMTKLPTSPLEHTRALEGLAGKSDEMSAFITLAEAKYGKTPRTATPGEKMFAGSVCTWVDKSNPLHKYFRTSGFLAALERQPEPAPTTARSPRDKTGISYHAHSASTVTSTTAYSAPYAALGLPNPQHESDEEAWSTLVRKNSDANVHPGQTTMYERMIANGQAADISISMINTPQELEAFEAHQQLLTAIITAAKAQRSLNITRVRQHQPSSLQERRLSEQRVDHHGQYFQAISSSEEYLDSSVNNEQDLKRPRVHFLHQQQIFSHGHASVPQSQLREIALKQQLQARHRASSQGSSQGITASSVGGGSSVAPHQATKTPYNNDTHRQTNRPSKASRQRHAARGAAHRQAQHNKTDTRQQQTTDNNGKNGC